MTGRLAWSWVRAHGGHATAVVAILVSLATMLPNLTPNSPTAVMSQDSERSDDSEDGAPAASGTTTMAEVEVENELEEVPLHRVERYWLPRIRAFYPAYADDLIRSIVLSGRMKPPRLP